MGTGASAGISAGAGSRGLPPHPRQAWAADAERPQRADESSEGAGGEGCWREAGGAGGGLWAGPGKGRRAAGRSHRAHGVRALLLSEVTRREARGRGQGLAALSSPPPHKKDKRAPGRWEGKSFLLVSREISPPNLKPQALQRRLGAECRVQGWLPGGAPRDCDPGALQSPAAHDPWELPPPPGPRRSTLHPLPPGGRRQNPILPLQDPQPPQLVPQPQSCASRAGSTAEKNLSLGTKYPLSGALLWVRRPEGENGHTHPPGAPLAETLGPRVWVLPAPGAVEKPQLIPGFPRADAAGPLLHAPWTLSYLTPPGRVGVPLAGCAGAAQAEPNPSPGGHCQRPGAPIRSSPERDSRSGSLGRGS